MIGVLNTVGVLVKVMPSVTDEVAVGTKRLNAWVGVGVDKRLKGVTVIGKTSLVGALGATVSVGHEKGVGLLVAPAVAVGVSMKSGKGTLATRLGKVGVIVKISGAVPNVAVICWRAAMTSS